MARKQDSRARHFTAGAWHSHCSSEKQDKHGAFGSKWREIKNSIDGRVTVYNHLGHAICT
jgi:hypothetical protein